MVVLLLNGPVDAVKDLLNPSGTGWLNPICSGLTTDAGSLRPTWIAGRCMSLAAPDSSRRSPNRFPPHARPWKSTLTSPTRTDRNSTPAQ